MRFEKIKNGNIIQALENIHHNNVNGKNTITYEVGAVTIFNNFFDDPDNQIGPTALAISEISPDEAWKQALSQVKAKLNQKIP